MVCMLLVYMLGLLGIHNLSSIHIHALMNSLMVNTNKCTIIIIIIIIISFK